MTPPRLARALLRVALPARHAAVILADLDEEFARFVRPARSRIGAAGWYWAQVIRSLPSAYRLRRSGAIAAWRGHAGGGARRPAFAGALADARFALRLLRRNLALTFAAVVTLAGGIAVTTASVSLAHAVLLRPLPYVAPEALVSIAEADRRREATSGNVSWPDFLDYQAQAHTVTALAGHNGGSLTLTGHGPADRLTITTVTPNFFDMLGVRPALGRSFVAADADAGPPVVILTDGTWRARFGGDPAIVGRAITLGGQPTTVVGVLPAGFMFPPRGLAELWLPMRPNQAQRDRRYFHWLDVVGRLRPGASLDDAQAEFGAIARGFARVDPEFHPLADARVRPFSEAVVGSVRPILLVVLGAASMLMLIACTNIAGLLVARASGRRREIEVRSALGAGRVRLARQLAVESLAMSVPAVLIGAVAGRWLLVRFVESIPQAQRVALPHLDAPALDATATAVSIGLALAAACAAGLAPAWSLLRGSHESALRSGVGGTRGDRRAQTVLLTAQIGLAVVLLSGAGLMAQSVRRLSATSPGFDTSNLLTMRMTLAGPRYSTAEAVLASHAELLARLERLPGIGGVATIDQLPLTGRGNTGIFKVRSAAETAAHATAVRVISPNYVDVVGVPILAGRGFDAAPIGPRVVLVNQTLNAQVFGGRAIGEHISFPFVQGEPFWEIVGVVGDEQVDQVDRTITPVVYFNYRQNPANGFSLALRTTGDPSAAVASIRAEAGAFDPSIPLFAIRTMDEIIEGSSAVYRRRAVLVLVAVFALGALGLAAIGIFSVVAQSVAARTREIGVRVTLGAGRGAIMRAVARQAFVPAVAGLSIGLAGSLLFGQALAGLLFGVASSDPRTLAGVTLVLLIVAAGACVAPARRALRINPVDALRPD